MQNLFDYLEWRGDLSFIRDAFNEVDNLVFSVLAYLNFDGIVSEETGVDSIPLFEAARQFSKEKYRPYKDPFLKLTPALLSRAAQSERYLNIKLSGYVNQYDYENSKQFSAVVFSINNDLHFIAFRGTDYSIIGWKEDFLMSFMDQVQAQNQAVIYTKNIIDNLSGNFYLGGHSKGGNLAVYAAAFVDEKIRERITGVYNNDGPGLHAKIIQSEGYQKALHKIITFVPKSSIIGLLLEHGEEYKIVGSRAASIMQHNAFTWEVKGTNFVYEKGLSKYSLSINAAVRAWLSQVSVDERAQFVDALFNIIQATGAKKIDDLSKEKLAMAVSMIKTYKHMDDLAKSNLKKTVEIFFKESRTAIKDSIRADLNSLFLKKKPRRKLR
ncbi:MAG TPA: hypothetical protein DCW46_09410 [Desulfotomaculum sp.]|nr:hypothetical protein [Desulfotomaculum sp.]